MSYILELFLIVVNYIDNVYDTRAVVVGGGGKRVKTFQTENPIHFGFCFRKMFVIILVVYEPIYKQIMMRWASKIIVYNIAS